MTTAKGSLTFLATLVCTATISAAPVAAAADASFEMGSYSGWPGGKEIATGDYPAAIRAAASRAARIDPASALTAATNLCVAYTVTREFDAARDACANAVTLARRSDAMSFRRFSTEEATSRALSNRGVLRALSGDVRGAVEDFGRAAKAKGGWDASSRNLTYLQSTPARVALAETSVPAPRDPQ